MPHFSDIGRLVQEETSLALAQALTGGELKRRVARATGRTVESIQEFCKNGRLNAPIDVLREALDLTGHPALFEVFATGRYHMVPKICGDDVTVDSILLLAAQKSGASGRVNDVLARALDPDGPGGAGFTTAEKAESLETIEEAGRKLAALKQAIETL